jgi:hypothetical protein
MWNRKRGNKYGAVKVEIDGIKFDSKMEARRYEELKLLKARELEVHPRFAIEINDVKVCDVELDFRYRHPDRPGHYVFEDVKGKDTDMSKLKRKLIQAAYPWIKVELIKYR